MQVEEVRFALDIVEDAVDLPQQFTLFLVLRGAAGDASGFPEFPHPLRRPYPVQIPVLVANTTLKGPQVAGQHNDLASKTGIRSPKVG
jgi:hypothetical protein